jgi:hypothetical protein
VTYPDWLLKPHGTSAAYRRHRRHGEDACQACKDAEARRGRRSRVTRWTALHADRGNQRPRCGHQNPHAIAEPGQDVTCKRCILLAEMARAA